MYFYCIQPLCCTAKQDNFYQGNDSDMTFVAGATKINLKNLKTWKYQLYSDGTFEPLTNSGRSLT